MHLITLTWSYFWLFLSFGPQNSEITSHIFWTQKLRNNMIFFLQEKLSFSPKTNTRITYFSYQNVFERIFRFFYLTKKRIQTYFSVFFLIKTKKYFISIYLFFKAIWVWLWNNIHFQANDHSKRLAFKTILIKFALG